jgi:hypothetical protein
MDKRNSKDPESWKQTMDISSRDKSKITDKNGKRALAEAGMPATGAIPAIAETPTTHEYSRMCPPLVLCPLN